MNPASIASVERASRFDSVVIGFQLGHSPETIQDQYPSISLEEVYGAITFYLANQQAVDDYLKKQEKVWEDFRAKVDQIPSPVVERLRGPRVGHAVRETS